MQFNRIIFPAPSPSYNYKNKRIIKIKRQNQVQRQMNSSQDLNHYENSSLNQYNQIDNNKIPIKQYSIFGMCGPQYIQQENEDIIPCLYMEFYDNIIEKDKCYKQFSNKIMIFFHGNAEDIGYSQLFMQNFLDQFQINIINIEYPGYGLYKGEPNSDQINEDSLIVYDFLVNQQNFLPQDIIVFGRSIGTGPATYLAANRQVSALILLSPYTSIKELAKYLIGSILAVLVAERFQNKYYITEVKCPILLIHGQKDTLIPFSHSQKLLELIEVKQHSYIFPKEMTHNDFDLNQDILIPFTQFFTKFSLQSTLTTRRPIISRLLNKNNQTRQNK